MPPGTQMEPGHGLAPTDLALDLGPRLSCCALAKPLPLFEPRFPQHIMCKALQKTLAPVFGKVHFREANVSL